MTEQVLKRVAKLNKELALYRATRNLFAANAVLREIQQIAR